MAKATCPSCGALGESGKECEYCGVLIPTSVKKTIKTKGESSNSSSPFSWYNVCPAGWEPSKGDVIGDSSTSLYMVVFQQRVTKVCNYWKERYEDQVDDYYAIINRDGIFVVDPSNSKLTLFVDNYDYIKSNDEIKHWLCNITTEGIDILEEFCIIASRSIEFDYLIFESEGKYTAFYDRLKRKLIPLDKPFPADSSFPKKGKNKTYIFEKDKRTWIVKVAGGKGIVTFKEAKEDEKEELEDEKEELATQTVNDKPNFGCIFWTIAITCLCLLFILPVFVVVRLNSATENNSSIAVEDTKTMAEESAELQAWKTRFHEEFVGKEYVSNSSNENVLKIRVLDDNTLQYQTGSNDNDILAPSFWWDAPKTVKYKLAIVGDELRLIFDNFVCDDLTTGDSFSNMFRICKEDDSNSSICYDFTLDEGLEISVVEQQQKKLKSKFKQLFFGRDFICGNGGKEKFRFKVLNKNSIRYQTGVRGEYPNSDIEWSTPQTVSYNLGMSVTKGVIDDYKINVTLVFGKYMSKKLGKVLSEKSTCSTFELKSKEDSQWMHIFSIENENNE